jgi:hypothetical protein
MLLRSPLVGELHTPLGCWSGQQGKLEQEGAQRGVNASKSATAITTRRRATGRLLNNSSIPQATKLKYNCKCTVTKETQQADSCTQIRSGRVVLLSGILLSLSIRLPEYKHSFTDDSTVKKQAFLKYG